MTGRTARRPVSPKWARRTKSLASAGSLTPATSRRPFRRSSAAPNLQSPSVIGRLKEEWTAEYERWQRRDRAKQYVYIGLVYLQARMEDTAACMLDRRHAPRPQGAGWLPGRRSWRELLVDLKARGLAVAPHGRGSRRSARPERVVALPAEGVPVAKYGAKYSKAAECLVKDREALLADFPAEHWDHLRRQCRRRPASLSPVAIGERVVAIGARRSGFSRSSGRTAPSLSPETHIWAKAGLRRT